MNAPSDGQHVLSLEDVWVELAGRSVLEGVELTVEAGAPLAVTGPSGSGKTMLCHVLCGVLEPTRGRVLWNGRPLVRTSVGSDGGVAIGLVLQTHGLVTALTAEENVVLPLQARRMVAADVRRRGATALESVGLADKGPRLVDELSGGERQRVGVARAIAGDPELLVADEPTSELDADNRQRVLDLLVGPAGSTERRIVVVASDDPEVLTRFPRVVSLDDGRLAADPRHPPVLPAR